MNFCSNDPKAYLHGFITGYEKCIYFESLEPKTLHIQLGAPYTSTLRSIHLGRKTMHFVWSIQEGIAYYKLIRLVKQFISNAVNKNNFYWTLFCFKNDQNAKTCIKKILFYKTNTITNDKSSLQHVRSHALDVCTSCSLPICLGSYLPLVFVYGHSNAEQRFAFGEHVKPWLYDWFVANAVNFCMASHPQIERGENTATSYEAFFKLTFFKHFSKFYRSLE